MISALEKIILGNNKIINRCIILSFTLYILTPILLLVSVTLSNLKVHLSVFKTGVYLCQIFIIFIILLGRLAFIITILSLIAISVIKIFSKKISFIYPVLLLLIMLLNIIIYIIPQRQAINGVGDLLHALTIGYAHDQVEIVREIYRWLLKAIMSKDFFIPFVK